MNVRSGIQSGVMLAVLALTSPQVLTGCNPSGVVQAKDKDCRVTDNGYELCTFQLKVDNTWFDTVRNTYDRCDVGELYPKCGDRRGN